jgi:hypothetical protein
MSNIYDILEICLDEIEKGGDIDSVLFRYPAYASELRPLLETAAKAIKVDIADPSEAVVRRNRARVLQHAALLREARVQTKRRLWSVPLRRALVTLIVVVALFVGSTGLVRASTVTLPGDNLYPIKRTWEDLLVLFTFNMQAREALEVEHENERLHEIWEVFTQGRSVQVDFAGLVTRQNGDLWLIAGVPVAISAETGLPTQPIMVGDAVRVIGVTQPDGAVLAQRIDMLSSGVPLPDLDDDPFEQEHSEDSTQAGEDNSGEGSGGESNSGETQTPIIESNSGSGSGSGSGSESEDEHLNGVVESINGNILVVDGQILNISSAEVNGNPRVGSTAKVEGYYDANGVFFVTHIEFERSGSDGGDSVSEDDSNHDGDSEDNLNDNDNHEEDDHEDNVNDSSGEGSGGGGDD